MKINNFVHLDLCKELYYNDIVIKSDYVWQNYLNRWKLSDRNIFEPINEDINFIIPAPTFQDIWEILPWFIVIDNQHRELQLTKYDNMSYVSYDCYEPIFGSVNPCDCIARILLWLIEKGYYKK